VRQEPLALGGQHRARGHLNLMPGDLLFTPGSDGTAEDPGHVGMYVGQGLVIQGPQTGEDIEVTPFKGYWQQNVVAVRRVV
jgi:cell wall-associated NlpC family hydrolase